jgi:hypothetical protein
VKPDQVEHVTLVELEDAVTAVQRQLEVWKLVGPVPHYEAFAERSALLQADRADADQMRTWTVGVRTAERRVLTHEWREYLFGDRERTLGLVSRPRAAVLEASGVSRLGETLVSVLSHEMDPIGRLNAKSRRSH